MNNHKTKIGVLGANTKTRHSKKLRSYVKRKSRALCGAPQKGRARCLSEATLDNSGNLLTGAPAVISGYGPTEFHTAYNLPCLPGGSTSAICSAPGSFGPETIAIVDAGNFSNLESSLQAYDQHFGLPDCTVANGCLTIVNQDGNTSPLPSSAGNNWDLEIALDVEVAHMVCQTCKIVMVAADSNFLSDLSQANDTAAIFNPVAISNSWGGNDAQAYDNSFKHNGIATVASTGDNGSVINGQAWPADIPDVVAASGTTLNINIDNTWASESIWTGSGGGCSANYAAPSWQSGLAEWATNGCAAKRAYGDLSAAANPSTGAAVNMSGTWYQVGGTSLSAPLIASMFALVGSVPSNISAAAIPYAADNSFFHDITAGNDCIIGGQQHCTTSNGFDTPSGIGSPNGVNGFSLLPTKPGNLTATVTSETQIHLSWTASSATAGINHYNIIRDGNLIGSSSSSTYNDSGLTANSSYTYQVSATDTHSNVSPSSSDANATTYYLADINADSHVNLLDFSLLLSKYGQTGTSLGRADINGDDAINLLDFSLLVSQYGIE